MVADQEKDMQKTAAKPSAKRTYTKGNGRKNTKSAAPKTSEVETENKQAETETVEQTEKPVVEKKKRKDKKTLQIEELQDKIMRNMAEFDNFRKRSEKEKEQRFEIGAKSIIEKILPVIDNFERGLAAVPEEEKENSFTQGMEKVYKQLMTSLTEAGVAVIKAEGKEFDPNYHNAVMHGEDDSLGENMVSQELQKGYLYHDSVVRHSMVKVVN